ncbi:hypothetical protein WKR98_23220 [Pigmentiphaga sp. YJ18]|uniref:hypothetical protein n=1 Tax=unclassified Pigmentiphaga TaxID=2626614 RepID=UPI00244CF7AC|nr:hypothetical protein [Pigmentiphaga sp. GD03639]MDH2240199.1 hypothetical protein [Pigmentiphaga sp. GD03639]
MKTTRYPRRRPYRAGRIDRRESTTAWVDRMIQRGGVARSDAFRQGMQVAHARRYMADPLGRFGRPATNTPEFDQFQAGYAHAEELIAKQL